ncbi:hypothetical protein D3C75_729670 [compost metagenome]
MIAVEHDGAYVAAARQYVAALEGIEVVAVEGAGQRVMAGEVVQPTIETAGSQAGEDGHHQTEQGEQRRRRLPQQHLEQGQQRDAVDQDERRVRDGMDELEGALLPVIIRP